ncbi:flagellin N-terminal-like domain-containing protein [Halobiforma haloterrestris]|uniref:Flagellin N-terminal-like domain-containing protein n=1 Tax=Natronobacterium haloterrestre TaxID=148448 RepID=A0A1I1F8G6_NATHA|nr:type IV pilin N-terminal domain-containing protein [Halobiforma haloterrestris]SFB95581.1 flagellin N-terminal-like domain-containing protein [Halobiforma haloterrestris]
MSNLRGTSSVVGVVLLVAITVILAGSVGAFVFSLGDTPSEPGPIAGVTTDATFTLSGTASCDEEVVRLRHVAGDPIDVTDMEVTVRIRGGDMEATLTDLPSENSSLDDDHVDGDADVIDQSGCAGGAIVDSSDGSPEWTSGSAIEFRVNHGSSTTDLESGDEVEILVTDTDGGTVVVSETLTA